jgi:hypothetical protein
MNTMYKILYSYNWYLVIYLDNIIVLLKIYEDNSQYIEAILQSIYEARLWLHKAKSTFGAIEITIIGYHIS